MQKKEAGVIYGLKGWGSYAPSAYDPSESEANDVGVILLPKDI